MAFTKNPSVSNAKIPIHYLIFIMTMSCEVQSSNQSNLPSPKLPRSGNFLSELKFYFPQKNSQQRACLSLFVGPITILIVSGLTTKLKTSEINTNIANVRLTGFCYSIPLASLFCPHLENYHHHQNLALSWSHKDLCSILDSVFQPSGGYMTPGLRRQAEGPWEEIIYN